MGNGNSIIKKDFIDKLLLIKSGTKIKDKWTIYLREIEILGQGTFGRVYLAESVHDKKLYVVKEMLTKTQNEEVIKLLLKEPETLEKLSKFNHPNLQNLVTWFIDSVGSIIMVI